MCGFADLAALLLPQAPSGSLGVHKRGALEGQGSHGALQLAQHEIDLLRTSLQDAELPKLVVDFYDVRPEQVGSVAPR